MNPKTAPSPDETVSIISDLRRKNERIIDLLEAIKNGEQIKKSAVSGAIDDAWSVRYDLNCLVTSVAVRRWEGVACPAFVNAITWCEMCLNDLSDWTDDGALGLDAPGVSRWLYFFRDLLGQLMRIYDKHLRRGAPLEYLGIMTEEEREEILREANKNTPWK